MADDPKVQALDFALEVLMAALFSQGPEEATEGLRLLMLGSCPPEARAHLKEFLAREAGRETEMRRMRTQRASSN